MQNNRFQAIGRLVGVVVTLTLTTTWALAQSDFEHHRATNGSVSIHAVTYGEGDPVVLIHGFPQHWWMWRSTMIALGEAGYQAIAIDQRGMGGSDIPMEGYDKATLASDVFAVMDTLSISEAAIGRI